MQNTFEQTTLCYVLNDKNQVLLIKKKKGLGRGKYNGPGGKVEKEENPEECAIREVKEEVGLMISDIEYRGYIEFITDGLGFDGRCHIFVSKKFDGVLKETDEARPYWVDISRVPCQNMWEDDQYWLPKVLAGGETKKRFYFDKNCRICKIEQI
jgi:8-oxo-dGTP diphosphatase